MTEGWRHRTHKAALLLLLPLLLLLAGAAAGGNATVSSSSGLHAALLDSSIATVTVCGDVRLSPADFPFRSRIAINRTVEVRMTEYSMPPAHARGMRRFAAAAAWLLPGCRPASGLTGVQPARAHFSVSHRTPCRCLAAPAAPGWTWPACSRWSGWAPVG
jgi:hypothetical protein